MRHLLKLVLACALFCAPMAAHAQPFSKSTLTTQLPQFFPDNTTNFITPALLRSWLTGAIESWQQYAGVNAQTGTTYTIVGSDYGQYVSFNNSSAVAVTLPAATAAAGFYPFSFYATNIGSGTATLTPTSGTINGASSLALAQNQSVFVVADGTNWQVVKLAGSVASTISPGSTLITGATAPCVIVNSSSTTMGCIDLTNSYLAAGTFSNITGVGTVTAGTWQATTIATGFGGTGATALGSTFSNGAGTLNVTTCTAAQLGACSPDNTTITASNGVLTAVGAAANSVDAGGATSITNGVNNEVLYDNGGKVGVKVLLSPGGFLNVLRNSSLTAWFHGTSGTATTTAANTNWTAEGVFVIPTGASVTWAQNTACSPGNGAYDCVHITGASSVTDLKIRFVVESYIATKIAGQTVTFQLTWINNSGSSITPSLTTAYPTSQDGGVTVGGAWGGKTTDLSATNMQACSNSSTCTSAYTLSVSSSATAGYEFVVDFGNNFGSSGDSIFLLGGFDARATPGVSTGTNASPPTPEIRNAADDIAWCQRFFASSFPNSVTPANATSPYGIYTLATLSGTVRQAGIPLPVQMRYTAPTLTFYSPNAGTPANGDWQELNSGTNEVPSTVSAGMTGNAIAVSIPGSGLTNGQAYTVGGNWTADASIWGG